MKFKNQYILLTLLFSVMCLGVKATHNRAGEITYQWISGYKYQIKIITYTNIGAPNLADRCEDTLYFGDGTSAVVLRSNGPIGGCSPAHEGVPITTTIKQNEYITTHIYPGPGTYRLSMKDPNRNAGILNMLNSVNQAFYIESYLVIPTFGITHNSSPVLTFPPIDNGCVGKCFMHNPGAVDADGDSLSYELTTCKADIGTVCVGYTYPATGGGIYTIDPITGTLTWCTPQLQGEYNLAILIKEWRKKDDGTYFLVGTVLRDLQVDVGACNNNPPSIVPVSDTCVVAGSIITKTVRATDPDNDYLTLDANGGPFSVSAPIATFSSPPGVSPVSGTFSWQTTCAHIRKTPYQVTLKVKDSDPLVSLVDFKSFNIKVIPPAPQNVNAQPIGTSIKVTWNKPPCYNTTAPNPLLRYCVYRKNDCQPWAPNYCEVGVPTSAGYVSVGCTTNLNDTTLMDTNGGNGLTQGTDYHYVVVAVYLDGSESYASAQSNCVQLKRDVPIIVNVDVQATDASNGQVFVRWIKPVLGTNDLDTTAVTGPYEFRLMHYNGFSGTFAQIYSVSKPYFAALNQLSDTTFLHATSPLNTESTPHTYRVEFYANGIFVGNGQKSSSVFLTLTPSANQITLNWQVLTPWSNYKYYIYRKAPLQSTFTLIDSTTAQTYTDVGLANNMLYCYKIQSKGQYSDPGIIHPLLNFSQEACEKPKDTTPPCSPNLEIVANCITPSVKLVWNNPNHTCANDVVKYNIYYSETEEEDDDLVIIDSTRILSDTVLVFDNLTSIAGCYAITAVDSSGNESSITDKVCIDNCPEYELPNVITINGDGVNDFFKAIKNKYVKDIDLKIYNRWGTLEYETKDPAFMWNGTSLQSKLPCSDGTYFYICEVNEIRVKKTEPRKLKGFLQIFNQ